VQYGRTIKEKEKKTPISHFTSPELPSEAPVLSDIVNDLQICT